MKKRIFSLFLALLMLATLLGGCQTEKETKPDMTKAFFPLNPADDGVLRILAIGNSFCYYFTDELYGMLKAAGIEAVVTNAYHSGTTLEQHWTWLNGKNKEYLFTTHSTNGKYTDENRVDLEAGIRSQNWDVITIQQHYDPSQSMDFDTAYGLMEPYAGNLIAYLKEKFPLAEHYWHHTWAYEVGYTGWKEGLAEECKVLSVEKQTTNYEIIRQTALKMCEDHKVDRIPAGDAWQLARADARVGDHLCARAGVNEDKGDGYHDGDIGGGQYLNACVWFETITGQSCIGNTFRPSYKLSETMITALQEAAHQAVAAMSAN